MNVFKNLRKYENWVTYGLGLLGVFSFIFVIYYVAQKSDFFKNRDVIYVLDIKAVVDEIKRDYVVSSSRDLNNVSKYETIMSNRFKTLDAYLKKKNIVIFEKSAVVFYPEGLVIDLTPEVLKVLGLRSNGKN